MSEETTTPTGDPDMTEPITTGDPIPEEQDSGEHDRIEEATAVLQGLIVGAEVGPNSALRVKAAAEYLGCSDRRVRDFIKEGRLVTIPGKPVRVTLASVEALAADRVERGVTATGEVTQHGAPTGTPSNELRQVLEAVAMLSAQVADLRAQLDARPAIETTPAEEPKRWAMFTRRNRASVPTNDATAAVTRLRNHYTDDELRQALKGGPDD